MAEWVKSCAHPMGAIKYQALTEGNRPYVCRCGASWTPDEWRGTQYASSMAASRASMAHDDDEGEKQEMADESENPLVAGSEISALTTLAARFASLERWWEQESRNEIERTIPKALDYGASDLVDIGRALLGPGSTDEQYAEAGVAFYACGKIARIMSGIREGRQPNEDSWFDLGVYARMALRIRNCGSWPGV